ncbi:unnamed protein product [Lepidochelys kempii]
MVHSNPLKAAARSPLVLWRRYVACEGERLRGAAARGRARAGKAGRGAGTLVHYPGGSGVPVSSPRARCGRMGSRQPGLRGARWGRSARAAGGSRWPQRGGGEAARAAGRGQGPGPGLLLGAAVRLSRKLGELRGREAPGGRGRRRLPERGRGWAPRARLREKWCLEV